MLRAVKNGNGVIIAIGNDQNQSGQYPADGDAMGTWCSWTFDEVPTFALVGGAEEFPMMFKENGSADGIEVRSDGEVLATPNG